ncbi:MAG: EcsC family protein [Gemmobacter sp.]
MDTAPALPATTAAAPPGAAVDALARRYGAAQRGVVSLLTGLGGQLEKQMEALPQPVRVRIEQATHLALERAYGAAQATGTAPMGRGHVAAATVAGAIGGAGGLPTALAELPVTVTLILRAIQEVAREHGFDPDAPAIRRECLRVFAAGSPLAADDGVNTAFIGARLTLTGPALHRMIAALAPRIAAALAPKLAAQAIPVLGAAAGAAVNAAYMRYFREVAAVRFGLLQLAGRHDPVQVLAAFRAAVAAAPVRRAAG